MIRGGVVTLSAGKSVEVRAKGTAGAGLGTVLLVGPEAMHLRGDVEKCGGTHFRHAESILEAVLMADSAGLDGAEPGLILTGISQEIDQLEPAVRSLKKVYPQWRIVLLCEVGDEVLCRKAKGWGAEDYLLLPVEAGSLREVIEGGNRAVTGEVAVSVGAVSGEVQERVEMEEVTSEEQEILMPRSGVGKRFETEPAPAREEVAMESRAEVRGETRSEGRVEKCGVMAGSVPGLPLMVQTVLLNDLMSGRADFTERAVATLEGYLNLGGRLKFVPAEQEGTDVTDRREGRHEVRCAVTASQQMPATPFGDLVLQVEDDAHAVGATVLLSQAAQLLGAMLAMARRYEQLRSLAITDELSGAYNRRYFMKWMTGLLERARLKRFRVTLMMFDIDDFKRYNDTFGHASGDAIIRELIKLLRGCSRSHDLVARLGGDEFAVVYWDNEAPRQPNSEHPKDAIVATERFRKAIQEHHWADSCKIKGEVSISGGLVTFPWDADTLEGLMERADEALLRAKAAGKNAIVMHGKNGTEECAGGGE